MNLDPSEKDIYINHQFLAQKDLEASLLKDASHIIIHDKLIGA